MKKIVFALLFALCCGQTLLAQQRATVRIDAQTKYQKITGFGGFVCSPQFGYNHMTTADIKKVWGKSSTVGCNIMRLYIPIGKNSWSQSLATAKQAKQLGLIVFASPWGQPAEWKTNGTINAKNSDGTTGKLKRENWADYAQYLEDYVQYLRTNGVELDAISIQNEPDWPAQYAGCLWDASEIAEFVKTYGRSISCKIMAPETLAVSDSYANALNKSDVLDCFDIYGGHQYGGIQSAYKNLGKKGKELWMTEYLINWNEAENNTRNFDFSKDFFNFFTAINTCMLGDFNAWIHYAAKRYYGMLGDGQRGTTTGVVTKRGYIMAHFAKFVTGMTRIESNFKGASLEGSTYLSETGDTCVCVVSNSNEETVDLTVDLPFYTTAGKQYYTSKTKNNYYQAITPETETCRPLVTLEAQSVTTLLFVRSRDRQPSNMQATIQRFDRIDDMATTKSTFGTTYQLSGKTRKFDHSNPLISSRTNLSYGYVALNGRFTQLVMQINKVTSTLNLNTSKTTLLYVNEAGALSSHDYGTMDFSKRENFDIVFDLSKKTLTDGCKGLVSITNDNWSSVLTITFGDVYLGNDYAGTLTGAYVEDDSNVLDFSSDPYCTSIDMMGVTNIPATLPWLEGTNRIVFLNEGTSTAGNNIVAGNNCAQLSLNTDGGNFHPVQSFDATTASLLLNNVAGATFVTLPFNVEVPTGTSAYTLDAELKLQAVNTITAHQPVLLLAAGAVTIEGTGSVTFNPCPEQGVIYGTYATSTLQTGDYVLARQEGVWGLQRVMTDVVVKPFSAYARLSSTADFLPLDLSSTGITETKVSYSTAHVYNLFGQKVSDHQSGIVIVNGKKILHR